ncbi:hypothetical protein Hanom_Chr12g01139281 [Helianthus anomalus]
MLKMDRVFGSARGRKPFRFGCGSQFWSRKQPTQTPVSVNSRFGFGRGSGFMLNSDGILVLLFNWLKFGSVNCGQWLCFGSSGLVRLSFVFG